MDRDSGCHLLRHHPEMMSEAVAELLITVDTEKEPHFFCHDKFLEIGSPAQKAQENSPIVQQVMSDATC